MTSKPKIVAQIGSNAERIKAMYVNIGQSAGLPFPVKRIIDSSGMAVYDMHWDQKENCPFNKTTKNTGVLNSYLNSQSNGMNFYSVFMPGVGQVIYMQEQGVDEYLASYTYGSATNQQLKDYGGSVFYGGLKWLGGTTWQTLATNFLPLGFDGTYVIGSGFSQVAYHDGSTVRSYHYPAAGTSYCRSTYNVCYFNGYVYFLEQTTYNLKRIQRGVSGSTTIVAALSGLVKGPFVSNGKCFYVRRQYPGPAEIYEITGATSTKIAESDSYLNEYDNQFNFTTPVINHSTGIYFPVNGGMNRIVSGVVEQVPINQLWVFNLSGYFVPFSSLSGDSVFLMGSNDSVYALSQDATTFEQIGFPGQFGTAYGSQCAFSTDNGLLYGGQDSTIQVWEKPYPWEA